MISLPLGISVIYALLLGCLLSLIISAVMDR